MPLPEGLPISAFGWLVLSVLLMGMGKGGFPVGAIALPLMILTWPNQAESARGAIAFMLPLLCCMDCVAVWLHRQHIRWDIIRRALPAALIGIGLGSLLFVSDHHALLSLSNRGLELAIGVVGLLFLIYRGTRRRLDRRLTARPAHHPAAPRLVGFAAGITSTLAHAAGPIMQMHLLPLHLPKLQFVGTIAGFFFIVNLTKMLPFMLLGRIEGSDLARVGIFLPILPLGVLAGTALVRLFHERHYTIFITLILTVTSVTLVTRALLG